MLTIIIKCLLLQRKLSYLNLVVHSQLNSHFLYTFSVTLHLLSPTTLPSVALEVASITNANSNGAPPQSTQTLHFCREYSKEHRHSVFDASVAPLIRQTLLRVVPLLLCKRCSTPLLRSVVPLLFWLVVARNSGPSRLAALNP